MTDPDHTPVPRSLDDWVGAPAVRTRRERSADAEPDELWRAAQTIRLRDTRSLGRLIRWRIPGTPRDMRFAELFDRYPFISLDEGPRHLLSGLCGRIWTLRRDYPRLSEPADFLAWEEPGTVRVLFAQWAEPDRDGGSRLVSETRVEPVDRRAGMRLRGLWGVIGRFEPLVATEPLALAVRRAQGSAEDPSST